MTYEAWHSLCHVTASRVASRYFAPFDVIDAVTFGTCAARTVRLFAGSDRFVSSRAGPTPWFE